MNDEMMFARLLDEYVDDLNNDSNPRLLKYLDEHPEQAGELLPLMNFIGWFKVASVEVSESTKRSVRDRVFQPWTLELLIENSTPQVMESAIQSGLSRQQVDQLRKDDTPIDLEQPNDALRRLAKKHNVQFINLLAWVRQLISSVTVNTSANASFSPAFTRRSKQQSDDGGSQGK